jgi:hypothetical protein
MQSHHSRNAALAGTAERILAIADSQNVKLRILGGLGIYLKCTDFQTLLDKYREPLSDIDLVCLSKDIESVEKAIVFLGYKQNTSWKMHFGYQRRIFYTPEEITVEIYLDKLYLCQEIDLRSYLDVDSPTLSPTELFLSRIQRVKLAPKDIFDLGVLLTAKDLGIGGPDTIDLGRVASLTAVSWPWWKTIHDNLNLLLSALPPVLNSELLRSRLLGLSGAIEQAQKSLGWKMRALVGPRIQWYANVE